MDRRESIRCRRRRVLAWRDDYCQASISSRRPQVTSSQQSRNSLLRKKKKGEKRNRSVISGSSVVTVQIVDKLTDEWVRVEPRLLWVLCYRKMVELEKPQGVLPSLSWFRFGIAKRCSETPETIPFLVSRGEETRRTGAASIGSKREEATNERKRGRPVLSGAMEQPPPLVSLSLVSAHALPLPSSPRSFARSTGKLQHCFAMRKLFQKTFQASTATDKDSWLLDTTELCDRVLRKT